MKLYFAGANSYFKDFYGQGVRNILISYPFYKDISIENKQIINKYNLFLDSGAFSVYTKTVKVDLDKMIEDYKTYKNIDLKCGLDVIGDAEATKRNCLKMKQAGLDIIPTFHYGEDFDYLKYYCQNFKIVALGGVAQLKSRKDFLDKWLNNCFGIIKHYREKVKIHGFAITSLNLLLKYPFYSVDSTSWLAGGKFGTIAELKGLKFRRVRLSHLGWKQRCNRNIEQMLMLEKFVTKVWEKRGIIW